MRAKKEIKMLLRESKFNELNTLFPDKRKLTTLLISTTYDKDDVVAWKAIEAIGLIAAKMSAHNPQFVRDLVNRLTWMIRDESGGIGWSSPEIIAEIVRNTPELCSDIPTIVASFHDERPLTPGVMLAIGRIGNIHSFFYDFAAPIVSSYLDDPEPAVRGYAAYAAGELDMADGAERLEKLRNDTSEVRFYEAGALKNKTVGSLADTALAKLRLKNALSPAV